MGGARPSSILLLAFALAPAAALAAGLSRGELADLKRGYAASALSSSEEPAVRAERDLREPSAGFMLGVALGAWTAARDQLDFDVKNPAAAGAPHASQGPPNLDAIEQDCREEQIAFDRLESRNRAAGLEPADALAAADVRDPGIASAWRSRRRGQSSACADFH